MDRQAAIQDNRMLKRKLGLEEIACSSPFCITGFLNGLTENSSRELLESLKKPENQGALTQIMFFQRYINRYTPGLRKEIEKVAIENHRKYIEFSPDSLPYALARFNSRELELIFGNLAYIQATQGCGGRCINRCGVDAVPRVRDRIPSKHLINVLEKIAGYKKAKAPRLYYASDPLEIAASDREFFSLASNYYRLFNRPLEIVTSIPPGSEELYKEICRKAYPSIRICVSVTDENVQELFRQGILSRDSIDKLALLPGNNFRIPIGVFAEEYIPLRANLITDDYREKVGINGFVLPGRKASLWNRNALMMTPYGIVNTMGISKVDEDYPQGNIVVSVGRISCKPFELEVGEQIDPYLRNCIVRYNGRQESPNRSVFLSNLGHNARILIDESGKILYHERIEETMFIEAKAF